MKMKIFSLILSMAIMAVAAAQSATIPLWKLEDLKRAINEAKEPTIMNFWATFCKPCIEEIPHFQDVVKKYDSAGVRLVLVNLDMKEAYPKKISDFAKKRKFTAPITFLDETNADLFCPAVDASWSGAIPATIFINPRTGYRRFIEEPLKKEELEKEIKAMLAEAR